MRTRVLVASRVREANQGFSLLLSNKDDFIFTTPGAQVNRGLFEPYVIRFYTQCPLFSILVETNTIYFLNGKISYPLRLWKEILKVTYTSGKIDNIYFICKNYICILKNDRLYVLLINLNNSLASVQRML